VCECVCENGSSNFVPCFAGFQRQVSISAFLFVRSLSGGLSFLPFLSASYLAWVGLVCVREAHKIKLVQLAAEFRSRQTVEQ
jgi:hypothetical protein